MEDRLEVAENEMRTTVELAAPTPRRLELFHGAADSWEFATALGTPAAPTARFGMRQERNRRDIEGGEDSDRS